MNKTSSFGETIAWYDENAKEYFLTTKCHPRNVHLFTPRLPGKKILDAGCGSGHDANMFTGMGFEPIGVDISQGLLSVARQKYPKQKFVEGNLLSLPFPDNSFDGVWAQASLLHLETIEDVKQALNEFYRVLVPHVVLYIRVRQQEGERKTEIIKDINSTHPRFFRYFTEEELRELFFGAGFTLIKSDTQESNRGRSAGFRITMIGRKRS